MAQLISWLVIFAATPALAAGGDLDGDGFTAAQGDCDDTDSRTFPGAYESCDGVDNDCDGIVDDGCNPGTGTGTGTDTGGFFGTDTGYTGYTGGPARDADGDGHVEDDCDDTNVAIYPGAIEECNSIDDDCDGVVDEDCETTPTTPDTGTRTDDPSTGDPSTGDPSTDDPSEDVDTGVETKGLGCSGTGGSYAALVMLPLSALAMRRRKNGQV